MDMVQAVVAVLHQVTGRRGQRALHVVDATVA